MKYIDAERLKDEIERKIAQYSDWAEEEWEDDREYNHGAFGAFKNVRLIIDSLQQEQPIQVDTLTWKDIVELEGIINNVHYDFSAGIGQESFGKEVLERFREGRDEQEQPEKSKKDCNGCPHCVDRKDQYGWHFKGCFGGPYKGKFIAEIDECPIKNEQPVLDFKIEERKWVHDAVDNVFPEDGDFMSEADFRKILKDTARHFYELGLKAKEENK